MVTSFNVDSITERQRLDMCWCGSVPNLKGIRNYVLSTANVNKGDG